jgi:hypothetical protein
MLGKEYSQNEIIIGIISIIGIYYFSLYINISLFQVLMIIITCGTIYVISVQRSVEIEKLKTTNNLSETDNKNLLKFVDNISYFNKYNPEVYSQLITKIKNYIKLSDFVNQHESNNYKLYPKKILKENLSSQKKDILETFLSFEHTLDDRITSSYKLIDMSNELNKLLIIL